MPDIKDFRKVDERRNPEKKIKYVNSQTDNAQPAASWWKMGTEEVLDSVKSMLGMLENNLSGRMSRYRIEARLYGIPDYYPNVSRQSSNFYANNVSTPDRLSFNVCQSNVDTLTSKLSRIRPRARFLTNNGGFRAVKVAKKMGYFADGIFQENDIYSLGRSVLRDALVFGDGFLHLFSREGRVRIERVSPYEVFCDELECVGGGNPTHIYRLKLVSRGALMDMYPQYAEGIAQSQQLFNINIHTTSPATDQIELLECWKLGAGNVPGKHLLAVPDCVLDYGDWTGKYFPLVRLSWTQPFNGYFSQSLVEQLKGTQLELNKLLAVLQRSYQLAGSFRILVPNGSQVPKESFNNAVGTIISYVGGQPPSYITPPILPPEMYRQIDTLIERSYQISGISQLSAFSQKPAGLNSGRAIREFNDIETSRFQEFSQDIEQFYVDVARASLQLVREIAQNNGGSYPVQIKTYKSLETIDFRDIDMAEANYTISVFPASSLPQDPAGRLEAVDDLVQRGLIDATEQRELLSFPDVEAANTISNAQDEYLKEVFEKMLDEGIYTAPEGMDNLGLAQKLCLQYYALGKKLGESEEKLELFRQFMRDVLDLQAPPPTIPNLPQPELGAMAAPAELEQLALPSASGPIPGAEMALAQGAGLQPIQ